MSDINLYIICRSMSNANTVYPRCHHCRDPDLWSSSHPLPVLPNTVATKNRTWPAHFLGVFYIENIRNRFVDCIFKDEDEELQKVTVVYYTNRNATPYPETSSDIQIGKVYLLHGLWVITNGDYLTPTVSCLIFPYAHYIVQLQALNAYRLSIYGEDRNFEGAPAADPIVAKMSPMHLSCTAMVKIVKPLQVPVSQQIQNDFPEYRQFTAEICQYINSLQVLLHDNID